LKINIEELKNQKQKVFHFNECLSGLDLEGASLLEPVEAEFSLEVVEDEVLVKGSYRTKVQLTCVRCLDKFEANISGEIESVYFTPEAYKEHYDSKGIEYQSDKTVIDEIVDGQIDISELIREQVILDLPPFPICQDSCEGIEEMGDYSNDGIDPRWQKLLDIEKKN